ncbi:hypothetical protein NL676_007079 [Syzygium grande]|nr:hypothetical protein NL676_007079 [Syzygium grande]
MNRELPQSGRRNPAKKRRGGGGSFLAQICPLICVGWLLLGGGGGGDRGIFYVRTAHGWRRRRRRRCRRPEPCRALLRVMKRLRSETTRRGNGPRPIGPLPVSIRRVQLMAAGGKGWQAAKVGGQWWEVACGTA